MRPPVSRTLLRLFLYVWVLPTTLPGLILAVLALVSRGHVARVAGTLEVHGGWMPRVLDLHVPTGGRVEALALGHVIIARSAGTLARYRRHERVHVRQCERWGPLFLPAYAGASLWAWARGGHPYRDNVFEREAVERAAGVN